MLKLDTRDDTRILLLLLLFDDSFWLLPSSTTFQRNSLSSKRWSNFCSGRGVYVCTFPWRGWFIDWRASGIRWKRTPRNKSNKLSLVWQAGGTCYVTGALNLNLIKNDHYSRFIPLNAGLICHDTLISSPPSRATDLLVSSLLPQQKVTAPRFCQLFLRDFSRS